MMSSQAIGNDGGEDIMDIGMEGASERQDEVEIDVDVNIVDEGALVMADQEMTNDFEETLYHDIDYQGEGFDAHMGDEQPEPQEVDAGQALEYQERSHVSGSGDDVVELDPGGAEETVIHHSDTVPGVLQPFSSAEADENQTPTEPPEATSTTASAIPSHVPPACDSRDEDTAKNFVDPEYPCQHVDDNENGALQLSEDQAQPSLPDKNARAPSIEPIKTKTTSSSLKPEEPLHPVTLDYEGIRYLLFPPQENELQQNVSSFLPELGRTQGSLAELLAACREALADSAADDELELTLDDLGIKLSETSHHASTLSLSAAIDTYLNLLRNDGEEDVQPFRCSLHRKPSFSHRWKALQQLVSDGKGLSALRAAREDQPNVEDDHQDESKPDNRPVYDEGGDNNTQATDGSYKQEDAPLRPESRPENGLDAYEGDSQSYDDPADDEAGDENQGDNDHGGDIHESEPENVADSGAAQAGLDPSSLDAPSEEEETHNGAEPAAKSPDDQGSINAVQQITPASAENGSTDSSTLKDEETAQDSTQGEERRNEDGVEQQTAEGGIKTSFDIENNAPKDGSEAKEFDILVDIRSAGDVSEIDDTLDIQSDIDGGQTPNPTEKGAALKDDTLPEASLNESVNAAVDEITYATDDEAPIRDTLGDMDDQLNATQVDLDESIGLKRSLEDFDNDVESDAETTKRFKGSD